MSRIVPTVVSCPGCGQTQRMSVFESLSAERIPAQLELVVAGTFERVTCACGHTYQPEHPMLLAGFSTRLWIVMQPRSDRPRFATIERGVELVLEQQFADAPPGVMEGIRGVRPRLVFGQHMLSDAVRTAQLGLAPTLVECARLMAVRNHLRYFMSMGPSELCFTHMAESGELMHDVCSLISGERLDTFALPSDALAAARAHQAELQQSFPDLFDKPYISASRYLVGATIG